MNRAIFIGRVTDDITLRTNGTVVSTRFTVAVPRRVNSDKADFIPMVAFGKTAELMEKFLHKGSKVAIEGRFQSGSYQTEIGTTNYTLDCIVETFEALEPKNKE